MNIPFTQTKEYLSWHQAVGTKTFYKEFFRNGEKEKVDELDFQIDGEERENLESRKYAVVASVVIELRIGKVLYVPYGPCIIPLLGKVERSEELGEVELAEIFSYLKDLAKKENCIFVRLESFEDKKDTALWGDKQNIYPDGQNLFRLLPVFVNPPKKSFAKEGVFQPRMEWWLDLQESEDELLNRIHKDHRYSIRRAQKENIQIELVKIDKNLSENDKEKYFNLFWDLMKTTGERDGFSIYEKKYYQQIFNLSTFREGGQKFLVFTKYSGSTGGEKQSGVEEYLSVALVVISDKIANLVFAGSVGEKRELGFNHLMQWEAIKHAKELGCVIYNFGGIYENGFGKPGLLGVTNFKKRFGGYAKFHGDFVDMPIQKIKYFLYIIRKMM